MFLDCLRATSRVLLPSALSDAPAGVAHGTVAVPWPAGAADAEWGVTNSGSDSEWPARVPSCSHQSCRICLAAPPGLCLCSRALSVAASESATAAGLGAYPIAPGQWAPGYRRFRAPVRAACSWAKRRKRARYSAEPVPRGRRPTSTMGNASVIQVTCSSLSVMPSQWTTSFCSMVSHSHTSNTQHCGGAVWLLSCMRRQTVKGDTLSMRFSVVMCQQR